MGKRSDFERNPRDFYPTPYEAVEPLLGHIVVPYSARCNKPNFIEPCAGDGRLVRHLTKNGMTCVFACDIEPQADWIKKRDILFFDGHVPSCDLIITNPPWQRCVLHPMIEKFRHHAPTWLLFDSGWMFTGQAKPILKFCQKIVSVGRISWMQNGTSGMDDCCWYLFGSQESKTIFVA